MNKLYMYDVCFFFKDAYLSDGVFNLSGPLSLSMDLSLTSDFSEDFFSEEWCLTFGFDCSAVIG